MSFDLDGRLTVVEEADRGDSAVLLARRSRSIDAVVLDYHMPGGTGLDVLPALREALPDATIVLCPGGEPEPAQVLQRIPPRGPIGSRVVIEFLLPRTDRGVACQAALAAVILSGALYAARRDPEVRLLVSGLAVLTASWFALRTLHLTSPLMSAARQRWRVALSLVSLLASACGGGPASSPAEPAISSTAPTRTAPPPEGVREDLERFHFQAETLDGTSVDTRAFVGREPVAFWAWAPWCSTCNREAPGVRDAVVRYGGSIRFVGLPGLDDVAPMRVFVQRHELTAMPHAVDRQGDLWRQLGVRGQPTWVLVDVEGNVERLFGLVDAADLDHRLARLAGEPGHGGS